MNCLKRHDILNKATDFRKYLLKLDIPDLENWSRKCNVYIYSGIIRDFFLGNTRKIRDIDIVLDCDSIADVIHNESINYNRFGGLKLHKNHMSIDVWLLKDTWGIKRKKLEASPESLLETAFYNFSTIVYHYNTNSFIFKEDFLSFINNNMLDCVYEENPLPELCIINTMYYQNKFKLKISENLRLWILSHSKSVTIDYLDIQRSHFGKVIFTEAHIDDYINKLKI